MPALLLMGKEAEEAVGTSFLVILATATSALVAHARLGNVDYLEGFPTVYFKRLFALVLIGLPFPLLRS